jgi:ABC-type lipoprotein release transport system permease subunit
VLGFGLLWSSTSVVQWVGWHRWFIPVNIILGAFLGCLIGYVMALIIKPPPQFFNFFVIMIGIGKQARWFWIPKPLIVSTNIKDFFWFVLLAMFNHFS